MMCTKLSLLTQIEQFMCIVNLKKIHVKCRFLDFTVMQIGFFWPKSQKLRLLRNFFRKTFDIAINLWQTPNLQKLQQKRIVNY